VQKIVTSLKKFYDPREKKEKCGLILMDGTIVSSKNLCGDPEKGFILDPADLVRYEDNLYGTWHTHPGGTANLSEEDWFGFQQWPDLKHFVIGVDGVRCFVVEGSLIIEEELD
jgi:proteasome lid subunit RPN8/RPN11